MKEIPHVCMINRELMHAKAKHPFFAHRAMDPYAQSSDALACARKYLEQQIRVKQVTGDDVFACEYAEAFAAYSAGRYDHAIQELAQCCAVLIRIMELIEQEKETAL